MGRCVPGERAACCFGGGGDRVPVPAQGTSSRYWATMERALSAFEDLRRPGAACLDLAWTACGVFDGFFELGLAAWDVAAGGLLVQEAGGVVSDWEGGSGWLGGDILAGPVAVQEVLLDLARPVAP